MALTAEVCSRYLVHQLAVSPQPVAEAEGELAPLRGLREEHAAAEVAKTDVLPPRHWKSCQQGRWCTPPRPRTLRGSLGGICVAPLRQSGTLPNRDGEKRVDHGETENGGSRSSNTDSCLLTVSHRAERALGPTARSNRLAISPRRARQCS